MTTGTGSSQPSIPATIPLDASFGGSVASNTSTPSRSSGTTSQFVTISAPGVSGGGGGSSLSSGPSASTSSSSSTASTTTAPVAYDPSVLTRSDPLGIYTPFQAGSSATTAVFAPPAGATAPSDPHTVTFRGKSVTLHGANKSHEPVWYTWNVTSGVSRYDLTNILTSQDESGSSAVCFAKKGFCATCHCRDITHASSSTHDFGNPPSFPSYVVDGARQHSKVQVCRSGEMWSEVVEVPVEDSSGGGWWDWLQFESIHAFFSFVFLRINMWDINTTWISKTEMVALPLGIGWKGTYVGWNGPVIWRGASYYLDGGGKYENFYAQYHRAGKSIKMSSPVVAIQGRGKFKSRVSISTAAPIPNMWYFVRLSYFAQFMRVVTKFSSALHSIPPLWYRFQRYINNAVKHADVTLDRNHILMRAGGPAFMDTHAAWMEASEFSGDPFIGKWYNVFCTSKVSRINKQASDLRKIANKTKKKMVEVGLPSAQLSLMGGGPGGPASAHFSVDIPDDTGTMGMKMTMTPVGFTVQNATLIPDPVFSIETGTPATAHIEMSAHGNTILMDKLQGLQLFSAPAPSPIPKLPMGVSSVQVCLKGVRIRSNLGITLAVGVPGGAPAAAPAPHVFLKPGVVKIGCGPSSIIVTPASIAIKGAAVTVNGASLMAT